MKKLAAVLLCIVMGLGGIGFAACSKQADVEPALSGGSEDKVTEELKNNSSANAEDTKTNLPENGNAVSKTEALKEALRAQFLVKADEVIVTEDAVSFTDAASTDGSKITVKKNPKRTVNLYASFTTLWYEAGGTVIGLIGGDSSAELYEEYIGRDITKDDGITVVATSSSGKKWDVESILAVQPDLILCSTAMSGYSTMQAPAAAAGIQVVAVEYDDFSDYLKWFKVFCNLNNHPELWDLVAMPALEEVVSVLATISETVGDNAPTVFSMFSGANSLQANTSNTVVGGMIRAMKAVNIVDTWENTTAAERLDINLETVFAAKPDIIIVQCHAGGEAAEAQVAEFYGSNPVWKEISAVKNGKVFYLEKTLFHNKPNSRFAEAYQKLAKILYPDVVFSFEKK